MRVLILASPAALLIPLSVPISALFSLALISFCRPCSPLCHLIRPQRCQLKLYLYCFRFRCCFLAALSHSFCYATHVRGRCLGDQFDLQFVAPRLATRCTTTHAERIHPDVPHLCGAPSRISFKFELQQLRPPIPTTRLLRHALLGQLQFVTWSRSQPSPSAGDCSFSFTVTSRSNLALPLDSSCSLNAFSQRAPHKT